MSANTSTCLGSGEWDTVESRFSWTYPPTGVNRLLQSTLTVGEMECFPGEHQLYFMRLIDMLIVHDSKGMC